MSERYFPLWFSSGKGSGQCSCLLEVMIAYIVDSIASPSLGGQTVPFYLDPLSPRSSWFKFITNIFDVDCPDLSTDQQCLLVLILGKFKIKIGETCSRGHC